MVTTFQTLAAEEAQALTIDDSLMYTLIGIVTVFAVLVMLIVLIEVLHAAFKDRKKPVKATVPVAPIKAEKRISAGVMAEAPDAMDAEKDGDFIAAISAAITCVTGNSDFKIKSIKKG